MRTITGLVFIILVVLVSFQGCCQTPKVATSFHYEMPIQYNDGLNTDELTNVGMDTCLIFDVSKKLLADSIPNVHSLLIYKDDKLVYEKYFAGRDQKHGKRLGCIEHSVNQLHDCRSISKSIISACIGIALQKGFISGIDDPIVKYFPELENCKDSLKRMITIRHLLTMTSGLSWHEIGTYGSPFNDEIQMNLRFNPIRFILKKAMVARPGTLWNYNGGNTQLLAEIIYRQSGLPINKFAEKYLFNPLGIQQYEWVRLVFKNVPSVASGLRLTSRDMLKFGLLYMNKGQWNGASIIDSNWINQSFESYINRPHLKFKIRDGGYGYQFWTYSDAVKTQPFDIIEAKGNGGQSVFICKQLHLLVVTTAGNYNKPGDNPYMMLTKYIVPSIK